MKTESTTYNLLNSISYPEDLRKLSVEQLPELCEELRQDIIQELSCNPGHFAASLGTVELTVALHYVYNTPYDRIVWDVGHQAYGHKILTGRREAFHTLRKFKGISGFPNPLESPYDAFVAGHASNSISAAMGMSVASALKGEKDRHVIAVIGDGAMTGGLAFEGLNNASANPNNLLIILNDNDMAIDHAVGGLSQYLVDITTSQAYNKMRYDVYRGLRKMKLINNDRRGNILRFNNSLKALLTQQHNLFEGFSIRYFGPIDGHDVGYMIKVLNDIKDMEGPKLLHIKTKKGKGFKPAEKSATEWHAPGLFNKETGERIIVHKLNEPQLYQDVFGHTLVELAEQDERIVGVTPAMPTGCSMTYMMKAFPKRAFDVGIAEGHSVTFSAGLAKEGTASFDSDIEVENSWDFGPAKKKKGKNRKGKDERKRQRLEGGRVCFLKAPAPFRRQNYFLRTREKFSRQRSEAKHLSFRNPPIPAVLFHGERISKTTKAEMPRGGRSESGSRLFVSFQP